MYTEGCPLAMHKLNQQSSNHIWQVYRLRECYVQRIASWLSLAKCKIEMQLILNPQCSKLANIITEICGRITMLVYYIVDIAYFAFCK